MRKNIVRIVTTSAYIFKGTEWRAFQRKASNNLDRSIGSFWNPFQDFLYILFSNLSFSSIFVRKFCIRRNLQHVRIQISEIVFGYVISESMKKFCANYFSGSSKLCIFYRIKFDEINIACLVFDRESRSNSL